MEKMNGSGSKPSADMVSEPVESYYGISSNLRQSGIISSLRSLSRDDTVWIIRFLQNHLDEMSDSISPKVNMSPLDTLEQLGELVRATGKSPEQMCEEHLKEKYAL